MPNLASNFCQDYRASEHLSGYIARPKDDPDSSFEDFLTWYGAWERYGAYPSIPNMFFWFQSVADAERALLSGQSAAEGRVRQQHCDVFVNFVNTGGAAIQELRTALQERLNEKDVAALSDFEVAMRMRQLSGDFTDASRGLLNGACFLFNEVSQGPQASVEREFYAIPGRLMLTQFRRDLQQSVWNATLATIEATAQEESLIVANIDIALQLRLGEAEPEPFPPGDEDTGVVIFGGE